MRYFVTGATGFIGGALARRLREAGHEVRALVRDRGKARELKDAGVDLWDGDIRNKSSMREPMQGCDGVFHVAAWYRVGEDARNAKAINVHGTRNVLELMRELEIPKGVYTSTIAIFSDTHGRMVDETYRYDGEFLSAYEQTKHQAHYEVALPMIEAGLPLVIVMPGVVYGPGDKGPLRDLLVQYLRRRLPVVPRDNHYCWSYIDDVVEGHIAAMEKGRVGESYILTGPRHDLVEVLAKARSITKIPAPRLRAGRRALLGAAALMERVERFVPGLPPQYHAEALRSAAGTTFIASNDKARSELGFEPRSLVDGLRPTLEYELTALRS